MGNGPVPNYWSRSGRNGPFGAEDPERKGEVSAETNSEGGLRQDLLRVYGFSTVCRQEKFYTGQAGSLVFSTSSQVEIFVLREDENPLPLGVVGTSSNNTPAPKNNTSSTGTQGGVAAMPTTSFSKLEPPARTQMLP